MTFQVLEELKLTMDQFIDLCILSGCDYCKNIRGFTPFRLFCNAYTMPKYDSVIHAFLNKSDISENIKRVSLCKLLISSFMLAFDVLSFPVLAA
jgi:hypothetical protein